MDNEKKNNNYINLFHNKDLINGIRINIDSTKGALEAIKEIFSNNKPNYAMGLEYVKVESYTLLISSWREWLITGNLTKIPYDKRDVLKKIFKFHSLPADHVICFQSYNLDEGLLMCRINKKFLNIIIPKIEGTPANTSIIATYT